MKIEIKVIANAKKAEVSQEVGFLKVKVNAPAIDGKANQAVIALLATYFKVKKNQISILKGEKTSRKQIEIQF